MTRSPVSRLVRLSTFAAALAFAGIMLGGCNDSQKVESARLAEENAALKAQNEKAAQDSVNMKMQLDSIKAQQLAAANQNKGNDGTVGPGPGSPPSKPTKGGEDVIIEVAGDVLFASGQTSLQAGGKKELDKIATTLKGKYASNRIRIEGYTDSDPIKKSKWGTNEALSQARADEVAKYLSSKGVSSDRITTVGMGAKKPRKDKAASRRVEIVVVGG